MSAHPVTLVEGATVLVSTVRACGRNVDVSPGQVWPPHFDRRMLDELAEQLTGTRGWRNVAVAATVNNGRLVGLDGKPIALAAPTVKGKQ